MTLLDANLASDLVPVNHTTFFERLNPSLQITDDLRVVSHTPQRLSILRHALQQSITEAI